MHKLNEEELICINGGPGPEDNTINIDDTVSRIAAHMVGRAPAFAVAIVVGHVADGMANSDTNNNGDIGGGDDAPDDSGCDPSVCG